MADPTQLDEPIEADGTSRRLAVLGLASLAALPFFLAAVAGLRPEIHAGLVGAGLLAAAAWKTQAHPDADVRAPTLGAIITTLFLALWLREAILYGWSPALALLPVPAVTVTWGLVLFQMAGARRRPDLVEGTSAMLFLTAAGLTGLTLPAIGL